MEGRKVPEIRFEGFEGEWEEYKLGEIVEIVSRTNEQSNAPVMMITAQNGFINQSERYVYDNTGESLKKYILLRRDELAYNHGASKIRPYGSCFALNVEEARVPFVYHCFSVGKNVSEFISFVLNGRETEKQLKKMVSSGARMDGLLNISFEEFCSISLMIPTVVEQKRVARYFRNLDGMLTFYQYKLEKLKLLKRAMIEKMFPKNGEKVPEIRFEGFTDDWEQRKFSDFTWASGKRNKEDLDLEPYAITNEHGFIPQNKAHDEFGYMKDTDRKAYNIVTPNSFAYNPARINVGSIGYYEGIENVIVSSLYEVFQTADYVDDRFLWHWFKSGEFPKWIERPQEGSVRLYFYYDKLCECQMLMPSVAEQKKIAMSLDNLDHLITLHQDKIEKLHNFKKSMLEKMFI